MFQHARGVHLDAGSTLRLPPCTWQCSSVAACCPCALLTSVCYCVQTVGRESSDSDYVPSDDEVTVPSVRAREDDDEVYFYSI